MVGITFRVSFGRRTISRSPLRSTKNRRIGIHDRYADLSSVNNPINEPTIPGGSDKRTPRSNARSLRPLMKKLVVVRKRVHDRPLFKWHNPMMDSSQATA